MDNNNRKSTFRLQMWSGVSGYSQCILEDVTLSQAEECAGQCAQGHLCDFGHEGGLDFTWEITEIAKSQD